MNDVQQFLLLVCVFAALGAPVAICCFVLWLADELSPSVQMSRKMRAQEIEAENASRQHEEHCYALIAEAKLRARAQLAAEAAQL